MLQNPDDKEAQARYQHCFADKSLDVNDVTSNRDLALEKSHQNFEIAFNLDFDPRHGLHAAYQCIKLGKFEEATKLAHIVELACLRDGGIESNSFEVLNTLLNVSCLLGKDDRTIQTICDKIQLSMDSPWKIQQHIENLNDLVESLKLAGKPIPKAVSNAIEIMETKAKEIERGKTTPDDIKEVKSRIANYQETTAPLAQKWKSKSFSYRGLTSNYIEGNFKFGGQLFDHSINRTDRKNFEAILQCPLGEIIQFDLLTDKEKAKIKPDMTLMDITDPEDFSDICDLFVRQSFRTKEQNLENLHSPQHKEFDNLMKKLILLSGTTGIDKASLSAVDSRTNISAVLTIGLGDCRHHAQCKQLLFDMWQRHHINEFLGQASSALKKNDNEKFEQATKEIKNLTRTELRTFDVVVQAPVQMNRMYEPINHPDGNHLEQADGTLKDIEEHTLNIMIHYDENGEIDRARTADSFYQEHYQWQNFDLDIHQDITSKANAVIAGTIPAWGANGLKQVPVSIVGTPYAGKRDKYEPVEEQQIMGHKVDLENFLFRLRVDQRAARQNFLDKLGQVPV